MNNGQKGGDKRYTPEQMAKMADKTDYKRLDALSDNEIDYSDIPSFNPVFWQNAEVIDPGKKIPISMRIDADVLKWFKGQDGRYQKLMNTVLRQYMLAKRHSFGKPPKMGSSDIPVK